MNLEKIHSCACIWRYLDSENKKGIIECNLGVRYATGKGGGGGGWGWLRVGVICGYTNVGDSKQHLVSRSEKKSSGSGKWLCLLLIKVGIT